MEIRPINNDTDISQILKLLTAFLKNPGDEEWYRWKHFENPFGKSTGSVAVENDKIIGVILFMKWQFKKANKVIDAVRLVDSATHPEARGKGLFRILSTASLTLLDPQNQMISFSTPNKNSLSSLLKSGWEKIDQSFSYAYFLINIFAKTAEIELHTDFSFFDFSMPASDLIETNKTKQFCNWRYAHKQYQISAFKQDKTAFLVYQFTRIKSVSVLVIKDFYGPTELFNPLLTAVAKSGKTYVGNCMEYLTLFTAKGYNRIRSNESSVVYKAPAEFKNISWKFSPGDLSGVL